jgi:hypothetical protein
MDGPDREYIDLKFATVRAEIAALEARCESSRGQLADHELRMRALERNESGPEMCRDHENRLRILEKRSPWVWVSQAVLGILAAFGIKTGL